MSMAVRSLIFACVCWAISSQQYIVPPANLRNAPYPEWAHYHWVWLSNDRANQSSMMSYAMEYLGHGIKVGAVNIDSGWSTGFNNFIFDTKKYPDPAGMIEFFHSHNMSIILWTTSMIDTDSSNYAEAHSKGYLLRNVLDQEAVISWWHGKGGLLDYTNPDAVEWWHRLMDNVLFLGIDGWKCDGTDPYVLELIEPRGKGGIVSRKNYSTSYYSDFFDYTRQKLGNDRLIMSRPVDALGDILYLDFSPQRVVFSGWVGDQDPTFDGLKQALKRYLQSAWAGYPNFGSDIGGYRSGSGTHGRTKELLIRWAQLGAFSPLMENGGNKEHRPWIFDNQTLNIYKKFVDIHYQLVPYLLSVGSKAVETETSSIKPLAPHQNFINKIIDEFNPPTYNYLLGDSILVAPITSEPPNVYVKFPESTSNNEWIYWFDHNKAYKSGEQASFMNISLEEYTVFVAAGKIIPLKVTEESVKYYGNLVNAIKWWLFIPQAKDLTLNTFAIREVHGPGIVATWRLIDTTYIEINITGHKLIDSFIEIESRSPLVNIKELQQDGEYLVLPQFTSYNKLLQNHYGYITSNDGGNFIYSVSIFPAGKKELGHSIILMRF